MKTDFLVIGSGIAGLSFALKAANAGEVIIVTKSNEDESNTKYAQGGIAAVVDKNDSFDQHINDTLIAGDGLCDREIVKIVVNEAPARIQEIIEYGTQFDTNKFGEYDLAREGGHSANRVLHFKDITGFEIERALLARINAHPNIKVYTHYFAVDIITQHHLGKELNKNSENVECYGAYVFNSLTTKVEKILAKKILVCTGGAGHVYSQTTNPTIATGDGIAMVYRAKGKVRNMEFIQFHPTSLYNPGESPNFLISEALRGFGAILKDVKGQEFMSKYDDRKDLAPRDIVARAIDFEIKKSGSDHVYLDIRHRTREELLKHFPNIYAHCLSIGIDISKDMIPVAPAAHYICGGIYVDKYACSSIRNLYALGECASTGLHGANRLASNSLLEALVFSHRAFEHSKVDLSSCFHRDDIPEWNEFGVNQPNEYILISHNTRELQRLMTDYMGIVRSDFRLERAMNRLRFLYEETEAFYKETKLSIGLCELRNLIQVAYIIVKAGMMRKESRGLHYNTDYPDKFVDKTVDIIF